MPPKSETPKTPSTAPTIKSVPPQVKRAPHERPPVSIRSGASGIIGLSNVLGATSPKDAPVGLSPSAFGTSSSSAPAGVAGFKFTPNLRPTGLAAGSPSRSGQQLGKYHGISSTERGHGSREVDFASQLAHSLTLRNIQQNRGSSLTSFDSQLRSASAPSVGGRPRAAALGDRSNYLSVQAKVQQHLLNIRQKKNKKGRKSVDLLELSWSQGLEGTPLYTPITLPYVAKSVIRENPIKTGDEVVNDEYETGSQQVNPGSVVTEDGTSDMTNRPKASKRPTIKFIDEVNRNASVIFDRTEETEADFTSEEDAYWLLVQMPSVLPALMKFEDNKSELSTRNTDAETNNYCPCKLEGLPEGHLGKIQIFRSGKATFRVGEHLFDINQGSDCNFAQEVAAIMGDHSELMFLGRCSKRMVISPDIAHYVQAQRNH